MRTPWKPALRKVCGLTDPEDAAHAVRSGANAVGVVFYAGSPRAVTVAQARRICDAVPAGVRRVGVFVGEAPSGVASAVRAAGLDVAQLHGDESPADCDAVREALDGDVEVWKAVRVGPEFDAAQLRDYRADAFLLDAFRKGAYGGTGVTFAWGLALEAKRFGPIVLSGGLDVANVDAAVQAVRPWGVDASSRLESGPGRKDPAKVAVFLRAVR